jgi:hypothetical protein
MTPALFISYSHSDIKTINWLDKLKLYLAPIQRRERVDIWDDTRLQVGEDWRSQINDALDKASAVILLVGPGFLGSQFIFDYELPTSLNFAKTRGVKIYPLIVGYCTYTRSELEPYQAFNDANHPLESLTMAEQNKILNDLSIAVDEDMRHSRVVLDQKDRNNIDLTKQVRAIQVYLDNTHTAFVAQVHRRDVLVDTITKRLGFRNDLEYEKFFFRYYDKMTDEEKFEFDQIRAITEGILFDGNHAILGILNQYPELLDEILDLVALRQHLVFWLNKYDKVFKNNSKMCLLYTGVEDGVPFPRGLDQKIAKLLASK